MVFETELSYYNINGAGTKFKARCRAGIAQSVECSSAA